MSTLIVNLDDESLLALHARLDTDGPDDPAAVEAHHTVTTEMARRGIDHGHDGDAWSAAVILVDSVEVDGPDVIEAPEELQKTWNATLSDGGTVSVLLTVDGYVLKADPTVSDVHVDAVMGGGRRRKLAKTDWKVGDFASWQSSGGVARGKILRIVRDGKINVPDSSFTVTADEDDPAVLLEVWRRGPDGWAATDTKVGHKASTLTKLESLTKADGYAVPSGVQAAARQALKWIADGRAGDGFTSVGRARAQQLADGGSVSRETLVKMRAYFARHIVDKDAEGWGDRSNPTPGMVAWYAWGGDAGRAWANKVLADDPVEKREIPAAINDLHLNVLNRQHAIDEYLYGPMNPDQPGDYWERLGAVWGVSAEQAQTTRCDNCSAFNVTSEIRTAIADAIGEGGEGVVEAADLGYCELLQFKCAGSRSCEVWLTGGPLSDHPGTDIHDDEPQPVAKFTLPDGAVYEFVVPSEPMVKHPGHGSQKVHGHRHAGATDLPDDITSEIKRTNRGVIAEAYGPEFARGRQARRGRDERGEPKPFRVSSTGTGKNELGQAIARRDMAIESLRKLPKGDDILGSRQTLVASIAANQGFIDGVVGNRAQFARSHSVGETLAGYLYGGLSGATKAVEPVIKHPGHPDQKVHAGRSASLSPEVARSIIERTRVNGGLSVNMVDGSEPPKGYMVARGGTRGVKPAIVDAEDFYDPVKGPKVLGDFLVTNRDTLTRGDYLGVWHDKQSGKVFLDVSENVMDRETAVRRGKRRDQISIWDVVNAEEIDTGGTGQIAEKSTNPSGTTAEFRRDDGGRDSPVRANTVGEVSGQSVVNFEPVTKHPGHSDQKVHGRRGGGAEAGAQSGGEYKGYSLGEPDNPPGEADKRRPDSIAAAKAMRDKIGQVEPQITRDMIDVATAHGGKMEGLDFRLKSEKSLARKIDAERDDPKFDGDPVKTAEAMSDVARYTMTFKDSEYTAGAQGVIDDLTKQGYELRVKNYWQPGDPYQGINIAAVHPGTGVRVELQLHTPTSLDFKEPKLSADDPMRRQSTHALYETYRESRDMRTRVSTYRSMMRQAAQIPVPAGAAALLSIGIPSFQPLTDLGGSVVSLA